MSKDYKKGVAHVSELLLDPLNPRFASVATIEQVREEVTQEMIREYLLDNEDITSLAKKIIENSGLFPSDIISCVEEEGKLIVLEGNRRVCACQLLLDRGLIPKKYRQGFPFIDEDTKANISDVETVIFNSRSSAQAFLRARHVEGPKKWKAIEKNNFYMNLFVEYDDFEEVARITQDSESNIRKAIKKQLFFLEVARVLKKKHHSVDVHKVNYLPMVDRFMELLMGKDEEVGLCLELDDTSMEYKCPPEKQQVFEDILEAVGEAFLLREAKNEGKQHRIISTEINGAANQKKLILEDKRIPGLLSLIKQFKGQSHEMQHESPKVSVDAFGCEEDKELTRLLAEEDRKRKECEDRWSSESLRLFISYHSKEFDKERVGMFKEALEHYGITSFVDCYDIAAASNWLDDIIDTLGKCDAVLAILTEKYHESNYTDQELGIAIGHKKRIFSLPIGREAYGFIARYQHVRIKKEPTIEEMASAVAKGLAENLHTKKQFAKAILSRLYCAPNYESVRRVVSLIERLPLFVDDEISNGLMMIIDDRPQVKDANGVKERLMAARDKRVRALSQEK